MSKTVMAILAVLGCGALVGIIFGASVIGTMNTEARLRTAIEAKQKDNTSEFDNMWKKISQVAQVTDGQKNALLEIFQSHAKARAGEKGQGGGLMSWIQESVPNVDTTTFNNLQNIIVGSRDGWTNRQKELVDLERERIQMFRVFPSNIYLSLLGRNEGDVKIQLVTSSRTERSFDTGKDDDVNVFKGDEK